jgi:hypothetical protein
MKSASYIRDGAGREGWMEEEKYFKSQEGGGRGHIQETFGHPTLSQLMSSFTHLPFLPA